MFLAQDEKVASSFWRSRYRAVNKAGNDGAHVTERGQDAAPVAPPEQIPKVK